MSQVNYINEIDLPSFSDIQRNQLFYFSGFLLYVNSWDWSNILVESNLDYFDSSDFDIDFSNPYEAISKINTNKSPVLDGEFNVSDTYRFPELYLIAATCRRYQIFNKWREQFNDIISPKFLESYSESIPSKTPLLNGDLTWSVWSGDIQAFTNAPTGRLDISNYLFAKKTNLQRYTPVSVENSSRLIKKDKGYGENLNAYITNYYNPVDVFTDELSTLRDGWYGLVTMDSTPYTIEPGRGIDFDIFFRLSSNKIVEFHPDYPNDNISIYGSKKRQYIDN